MAAFNFPNSPSTNDLHTENGVTFKWNGTMWLRVGPAYTDTTNLNVTGIGTFDGNVSIGGTLTYEDVKNVDSVGIISARAGIKVPDDQRIRLGAANDLDIYHTTSGTSWIRHGNTSEYFVIEGDQMDFRSYTNSHYRVRMGTAVELRHNNTERLKTSSTGVTITGDITTSDKIIHAGDTDTAIRFPSADTFSVETNSAERLRITSGGDVGVGNNSPNCRLAVKDVAEHTAYANVTPSVGDCMLQLYNNPPNETTNDHATMQFGVNGGSHNRVNTISAVAESASNRKMATTFCTDSGSNRNERVRISGDGNVGINEISPDAPLHITGGLPHIRLENSGTSASADDVFGKIDFYHNDSDDAGVTAIIQCVAEDNAGNSYLAFHNGDGGNANERLRIDSNGVSKFKNATGGQIWLGGASAHNAKITITDNNGTGNGSLTISGPSGDHLRMLSNGQFRILGTASNDPLYIQGGTESNASIRLDGGASGTDNSRIESKYNLALACNGDGNQSGRSIRFYNNTSMLMDIASDGKTSIGTVQTTHLLSTIGGSSNQLLVQGTEADIWLTSTGGSSTTWRILGSTGGSTHQFRIYDNTGGADRLVIDSQGRLSCGPGAETGSLSSSLHVRRNSGGTAAGESVIAASCGDNTTMISALLTVRNAGNRGARGHASGSKLASFEFTDVNAFLIDKDGKIRTNGATDTGHQGMIYIQGLSDPSASETKSNLSVRGEGGNGFACGTYEGTANYGSWIQAGYLPNFVGSSPSATYPLVLNPNGNCVCVGNYNDASTTDGGLLRVQSRNGTNFYNDCTLSLEHYNHSNAREQKWHFISASNQGTEAKSNSKFRQMAVPYQSSSTYQVFTDQIVYAHTVGYNQYSWYKFNTRASSSDRGGSARIAITWSTRHAAGTGYGEYSFAWRDEHNTSRIDCFLRKKHFRDHVSGTYYGWSGSPEVRVYNCTGGGSGGAFYLRLEGHINTNSGTYDGGVMHHFHIIHNDNNHGGNNSYFEFVGNSTPGDAGSHQSFN